MISYPSRNSKILVLLFFILFALCPSSVSGQNQPELDTLNSLSDLESKVEYILKIEDSLPFILRDSLVRDALEYAEESKNDTLIFLALSSALGIDWIQEEREEAKAKMDRGYVIAQRLGNKEFIASVLNNMGNYYQRNGQFDRADSIFVECIQYWETLRDTAKLSKGYNNRALVCYRTSNFEKGDSLVQIAKMYGASVSPRVYASAMNTELILTATRGQNKKAYAISEEVLEILKPVSEQHLKFYADQLGNNGLVATNLEYFQAAINSFLKADSIYSVLGNEKAQTNIITDIASLYDRLGDYDLAINYSKKGLDLARQINDPINLANSMKRLAFIQTNSQDSLLFDRSRELIDSAFQIYTERGVPVGIGECYLGLGNIFVMEGKPASATLEFKKALSTFDREEYNLKKNRIYYKLAEVLEQQGMHRQALDYIYKMNEGDLEAARDQVDFQFLKGKLLRKVGSHAQASTLLESAYEANSELMVSMQAAEVKEVGERYQADKQIAISEKLKAEQKLKEVVIGKQKQTISYGGVGLLIFSLLAYWFYQLSTKRQQLNSELSVQKKQVLLLNQELNHRVKNNLAFMTTLLEMQGRRSQNEETKLALRDSESRLKALSLVHTNLFKSKSDTQINLKEYIQEILGHLQEVFELGTKSLTINTHLTDTLFDAEDAMRVGLILNELVTNSVKHAFAQVDDPTIQVETILKNDKLLLRYKDNGPGIQEKELSSDPKKQGLGVKLIKLMEQQLADVLEVELGPAAI